MRNKAAHIVVGVDMDGMKHVPGIRPGAQEGAKFWADVCANLANCGVADVLLVCCDGLTGFPEAIESTWPDAVVQTCVALVTCRVRRLVAEAIGDHGRLVSSAAAEFGMDRRIAQDAFVAHAARTLSAAPPTRVW